MALLGTLTWGGASASAAAPADVATLSAEVRGWVAADDPDSAAWIAARVQAGLPAGVLAALADACRQHPRVDLIGVLGELSDYRRPEVRARALAARAELGGNFAASAIEDAADDLDPGIRRLAVALAVAHPGPDTDQTIARLLGKDPELAATGSQVPVAPPPAEQDEDDEDVIEIEEDDEVPFNIVDPGTPLENPHPPPDLEVPE